MCPAEERQSINYMRVPLAVMMRRESGKPAAVVVFGAVLHFADCM